MCRLGFLSCDAFQVTPGLEELVLANTSAEAAEAAAARGPTPQGKVNPVILLLAGVVKFNASLLRLNLAGTDLNDEAASNFAIALKENKTLESLDLSDNADIGADGVKSVASAVRNHPKLTSVKVDGLALPVSLLRGAAGADSSLDVADWGLGEMSGHMIGTLLLSNRQLLNFNLKNNALGAKGITAIVAGCGDSPLKALDATRTGLSGESDDVLQALSVSICRHLGMLAELRMDENELVCDANTLAPLCKLRNLRTLSLEKNRLSEVPSLIGTMLSLRRVLLQGNNIVVLPDSFCLLTGLEVLDVHKNAITSLPAAMGKMSGLQKLDISENKLTELPISFCELNEALQLSVGRNPLEKPSIEQARQGVGSIRRFFGWSKPKGGEDTTDAPLEAALAAANAEGGWAKKDIERPVRTEETPSRHDWAGPGSVILCFNCNGCPFHLVDAGAELANVPPGETIELFAAFNLQAVGRVREANSLSSKPEDRLEMYNQWLPWKSQDVAANESPRLALYTGANALRPKSSPAVVLIPWLAYGCSIGARLKTPSGFLTIVDIREDDSCAVVRDNAIEVLEHRESLDPRPDNVSRTTSPSYKAGQKLMLMEGGQLVDAVVEEWLGARRGSRHRVRLGLKGDSVSKAAETLLKRLGQKKSEKGKASVEVDLNESNHAKLLFSTGAKYEDGRSHYLDKLVSKHAAHADEVTAKELQIHDQRVFVRAKKAEAEAAGEEVSASAASEEAAPEARTASPVPMRSGSPTAGRPSSPPPSSPTKEDKEPAAPRVHPGVSALSIFTELIAQPEAVSASLPKPRLVWASGKVEHDMLLNQALHALAHELRSGGTATRLVPLVVPMSRIAEMVQDEAKRAAPRDMIIKAVEADYPTASDMLRQAMELRALVIVAEVRDEADLLAFNAAVLDELLGNRLLLIVSGVLPTSELLPPSLAQRCQTMEVASLGIFFNDAPLSNKLAKELLRRMRPLAEGADPSLKPSHYALVSGLHLSASELGRDGLQELQELLVHSACALTRLDLSYTQIDGYPLVQAMKSNASLTSLDVRYVPRFSDLYDSIGEMLLDRSGKCRIGYLRCDAFDVLEGESVLSLRERPLDKAATRLLAGLLRHNTSLHDLDLSATDLEPEGASQLVGVLETNTTLAALRLAFNPALDDECQATLRATADMWRSGNDHMLTF